ncbi:hypothetical protein SY87_28960 [Burkholderia pseudomallei]|nr:hypothetical protein SY87_28960 [Burkholderia pseudomallei]
MHPSTIMAAQNSCRIQCGLDQQLGIVEAWIAEMREPLECRAENTFEMVIEQCLRLIECALGVIVFLVFLEVSFIEATQAPRQIFGSSSTTRVRQMPLCMQEIDLDQTGQYLSAAATFVVRHTQRCVASSGAEVGAELSAIENVIA